MGQKMDIVAIRIGDKYGPEYETYLEKKLPEHNFIWMREPYHPSVTLQWNKMWGMQMDTDEPICVIDIDMLLVNDYQKVFDYPIKPGQFLAMPGWWRNDSDTYEINGGFFKYYPKECKYIYDKFMEDIHHWQQFYIKNGQTTGPVNGEQYFVEDSVNERLELITLPNEWFTRWVADDKVIDFKNNRTWQYKMTERYVKATGNDWVYMGGEFHPDIKVVHFTNHRNKPHEWSDYEQFRLPK
jgi:hypothetical protein